MTSFVYDSMVDDMATGAISFGADSFKVMLVSSVYVPDKSGHLSAGDITGEVSGGNYTAGGEPVTVAVTSAVDSETDIELSGASWPASTITARGAVYYASRGGAASADELVAFIDFGSNIVSIAGLFTLGASTIRIAS